MNQRYRPLTCLSALVILAACSSEAMADARHKHIEPGKKADAASKKPGDQRHAAARKGKHDKDKLAAHVAKAGQKPKPSGNEPPPQVAAIPPLSGDLALVRQAIDLAREAKSGEATALEKTIGDPAAKKLVEWYLLRHPDSDANFRRYAAFIADNPGWASMGPLACRAVGG